MNTQSQWSQQVPAGLASHPMNQAPWMRASVPAIATRAAAPSTSWMAALPRGPGRVLAGGGWMAL